MKKIFSLITIALIGASTVTAQDSKIIASKNITAIDTVYQINAKPKMQAFQYTFTKSGGTASGKVILEGTINGTYVGVDSFNITDVTYPQTKISDVSTKAYLSYRYRTTVALTGSVRAAYLRWTD